MLKRTLIILSLTAAVVIAVEPLQTVHGIIMTQPQWTQLNLVAGAFDGQQPEGNGSGLVKALKAPFKAIGRLFGGGKKKTRIERISEKDAKKFESSAPASVVQPWPVAQKTTAPTSTQGSEFATSAKANDVVAPEAETIALDHLEKGRALLNSQDLNAAIGELSLAASTNPKLSEASSLLGVAYWRKGLRDLAQRSFETAVNIDNHDAQNLNNLGFLLYENGDYENASKYLKRAAKLASNDVRIWNNLGLVQSERGHFDDAYKSFARAQGEYKGHLHVAAQLERSGAIKKAIKHLERAVALQPNSPDVLARLIVLYDSNGNEKQAQTARTSLETLRTLAKTVEK
jgi:Flp pilus assembly protein TadD